MPSRRPHSSTFNFIFGAGLILVLLTGPVPALAQTSTRKPVQKAQPTPEQTPLPPPTTPDKTLEQRAQEMTDSLAKRIDKTAETIDIMLAGKKYTKKANTSSVNVSQLLTIQEGGRHLTTTDFGLNLKLPNIERRWQLRFTSYNEEEENRDVQQQQVRTRPRERDYGAGLLFFRNLGKIHTMFQPRVQLKNPLDVSYLLRLETEGKSGSFHLMPRVDLYADPKKGTGEFASITALVGLNKRMELAFQNTEEYRQRGNVFLTQHAVSLDYSLKKDEALGIAASAGSINRPKFHLDSIGVSTTFAHSFSPDRFSLSLSPFITFGKSVAFKGSVGATLNLLLTL